MKKKWKGQDVLLLGMVEKKNIIDMWEDIAGSREASGRVQRVHDPEPCKEGGREGKGKKEAKYSSQEAKGTKGAKEGKGLTYLDHLGGKGSTAPGLESSE